MPFALWKHSGSHTPLVLLLMSLAPFCRSQSQDPLRYVPMTPCRAVNAAFSANQTLQFNLYNSGCGIPVTAQAYALNLTLTPPVGGTVGFIAVWPAGQTYPGTSTMNSFDGRVKSNAAIVPAGTGGAIQVFSSDAATVAIDVHGYFVAPEQAGSLDFYALPACRAIDTRPGGNPGNGPLPPNVPTPFSLAGLCGVPGTAKAYFVNITALPSPQGAPVDSLVAWPSGQSQPALWTLHAVTGTGAGTPTANSVIVPAGGTGGPINILVTQTGNVLIDILGYFADPGTGGLALYAVPTCRVVDTRWANGPLGGPLLQSVPEQSRPFPLSSSLNCSAPASAAAFVLNATLSPQPPEDRQPVSWLQLWRSGESAPYTSNLNAFDAQVASNLALVRANSGSITAKISDNTAHLMLDISGYFRSADPPPQYAVNTAPSGLSLTVDSVPCISPCSYQWTPGSNHTIATTSPQAGGSGIRYVFVNWSDGGALSHTITVPSSPATYTANFLTQFYLATIANPPAGRTITLTPPGGWYNSNATVSVAANTNPGYQFTGFSGALSGTTTPQNLTMNGPKSVTANFAANQPPTVLSAAPSSGSGYAQIFTFQYSDPNGSNDLASVQALFNFSLNMAGACYVNYDAVANTLQLAQDSGGGWLSQSIAPDGLGKISNSQCVLNPGGSWVERVGNDLKLHLALTFKAGFAGLKNVFLYASDRAGAQSGWQSRATWAVPSTPSSPLARPSLLEMNLGPVPIDKYQSSNCSPQPGQSDCTLPQNKLFPTCSSQETMQTCYRDALADYHLQGVTGVRFMFSFCGGAYSTALIGCGLNQGTPSTVWPTRLRAFFDDIKAAGINNITPSSILFGHGGEVGYVEQTMTYDGCLGYSRNFKLEWWPATPFPIEQGVGPYPKDHNWGPYCPLANNSTNFIGWNRIFGVIQTVLSTASAAGLTVNEWDVMQELALYSFTVYSRLIYDNMNEVDVLENVRALMAGTRDPNRTGAAQPYCTIGQPCYDPGRVTWSVSQNKAQSPAYDCDTVYGTVAQGVGSRVYQLSELASAIGGWSFGTPKYPQPFYGLSCNGVRDGSDMINLEVSHSQPTTLDMHAAICLDGSDAHCIASQSESDVALEARTTFNAIRSFIDHGGPPWLNDDNVRNALMMLGETYSNTTDGTKSPLVTCEGDAPTGPAGMVSGFNQSNLAGRWLPDGTAGMIFRPWAFPWRTTDELGQNLTCIGYRFPQPVNPPFTPSP